MSVSQMHPATAPSGRFWLSSYPDGMAGEIAPLTHDSIGALVESCCARFADRPAFTSMGRTLTFRDFDAASRTVVAWLQARGLEKGDRVAVMMPNILQNPVIIFGILRAGLVVVNVNPLYTPRELEHQLKDAGAKALFVLENFASTVAQVVARTDVRHVVVATMGDMLGLKGLIVNLVVRKVKKLVPEWSLPGHVPFRQVMAEGARGAVKPVAIAPATWPSCRYRRHDGRFQGRYPHPCEPALQHGADQAMDRADLHDQEAAGAAHLHLRAAALPYLRADGERADGHRARRP